MARGIELDPLFDCDFALLDAPLSLNPIPTAFPFKVGAQLANEGIGFISFAGLTLPTVEAQSLEIREMSYQYTHQIMAGQALTGEVSIRQAVVPLNFDFYIWFSTALQGRGSPRRNFYLLHLGRDKKTVRKIYFLHHCLPLSWRPSGDLDAASASVSLEEMTFHCERIGLEFLPPLG